MGGGGSRASWPLPSLEESYNYQIIVFFSNDKILRIYDLEQPSEPIVKFEGHTSGIKQVREDRITLQPT